MDREIKFRMLCKDGDELYWEFFKLPCCLMSKCKLGYENDLILKTLTEYTGLKDKNGKEIYEGDIIEYTFVNYGLISSDKRKVSYDEDGCGFQPFMELHECEYTKLETVEVIGNIYENPNLLKEE